MKARVGFVSNSSSSSFVLLGYVIPDTKETWEHIAKAAGMPDADGMYEVRDRLENDGIVVVDAPDGGVQEGYIIIGREIGHGDETGYMPSGSVILKDTDSYLDPVHKVIGPRKEEARIIWGTRMV